MCTPTAWLSLSGVLFGFLAFSLSLPTLVRNRELSRLQRLARLATKVVPIVLAAVGVGALVLVLALDHENPPSWRYGAAPLLGALMAYAYWRFLNENTRLWLLESISRQMASGGGRRVFRYVLLLLALLAGTLSAVSVAARAPTLLRAVSGVCIVASVEAMFLFTGYEVFLSGLESDPTARRRARRIAMGLLAAGLLVIGIVAATGPSSGHQLLLPRLHD